MKLATELEIMFSDAYPEYSENVYEEDFDIIVEAILAGKKLNSIVVVPESGFHDSSYISIKYVFDFINCVIEIVKLIKDFKKYQGKEPTKDELGILVCSSLNDIPEDVKLKCLAIDLKIISQRKKI